MILGIFDLEYSSRLLMVEDHTVQEQLVLDAISRGQNLKKKKKKEKKKKKIVQTLTSFRDPGYIITWLANWTYLLCTGDDLGIESGHLSPC